MCQSIGGVAQKHAIKFYVQLAFGEKANNVFKATSFDDLVTLCLRESWGPAFSHVSRNTQDFKEAENKEGEIQECIKNLYQMYKDYFERNDKSTYLNNHLGDFQKAIGGIKVQTSIRLGHFQKLFNMTTKHLLALYMLRKYIWDNKNDPFKTFIGKIEGCFANADCPIDSKILDKVRAEEDLSAETKEKWPKNKWSKFNDTDYITVQNAISDIVKETGSNLFYDFENW